MKLKAPQGVGNPCVAGDTITHCDGVYEVAPEIGALLVECFGFFEMEAPVAEKLRPAKAVRRARQSAKKT
jgi:hypothetical protein